MKTKEFLTSYFLRAARFCLLSKIHKPGHLGRPIVASNGAPTENVSLFVNNFLKPCSVRIASYILDMSDFLNELKELPVLPTEKLLLVTLDVDSLYTNIPHQEGITVCEKVLNLRNNLTPPTDDLCT